ncbi:hypothetical protein TNCV_3242071 [Trichonephila clavipes]|nr:hypothetical protein TNCV_3242071 [Trichonephila clavipes]
MAPRLGRVKGAVHITARVTNEGRKVRSGYVPFRTNASTLPVTPKRSCSRDVGTSSYRYHTATLLDIMIVQFRNEKVSNHGSIPINIDCNVVAFIVFEEGFHQPIKRTKQSVFLNVTVFRHTLPNAAVLFVDVAIQPEVRFIVKQNSLMKIGNNGNLVLDPFDESTPCLMIVLMNFQTKLRINHLTAVKSVTILETIGMRNSMRKFHSLLLCDDGTPMFLGKTAMAGSDVVQSGRPIFDDFLQHLWLYIGNNTANVVFQMVKRSWLIRIDQ